MASNPAPHSTSPPSLAYAGQTIQCQGAARDSEAGVQLAHPPEYTTTDGATGTDANLAEKQRIDREELVSDILRLRWLAVIGAVAWTLFLLQDLVVVTVVGQGRLGVFLVARAFGLLVILLILRRLRSDVPLSRPQITAMDWGVFSMVDVMMAIMCLEYGGIASRYITGVMVALIARSSVLAAPWRRGLLLLGVPLLAFPATFGVAAAFREDVKAQFGETEALATFGQSIFVLAASLGVCVWGGHGNWKMRRQLFASRNIGKYILKRCIGRGGMGEVWVAYHTGLNRNVALKILNPDDGTNPIALRRFQQEVAATTLLTHPNIVRVFDYGTTQDGIWYYAMELLDGVTLKDLIGNEGPLNVARTLNIAHRIARALAEAHALGIVHRDIKPENIFITHAGTEQDLVKVLDFGIAKILSETADSKLTYTGAIFGTPAYISPEAARGLPITPASDVYGLGGLIYFMLTGSPPFTGRSPTEVLLAHAERSAPRVTTTCGFAIDAQLDALVQKCLTKDPRQRYADAGELAQALDELRKASVA
ncbi:MAG: serine/threonine-protein kinase [Polyangiaceae bacterium]